MDEITAQEPDLADADPVDLKDWYFRGNAIQSVPGWFEFVGEFLSDVRYEYR